MIVTVAGVEFDHVVYDRDADVVYLQVGSPPQTAADFDESPEGHYLRYDERGALMGITIVNAPGSSSARGRSRSRCPSTASRQPTSGLSSPPEGIPQQRPAAQVPGCWAPSPTHSTSTRCPCVNSARGVVAVSRLDLRMSPCPFRRRGRAARGWPRRGRE